MFCVCVCEFRLAGAFCSNAFRHIAIHKWAKLNIKSQLDYVLPCCFDIFSTSHVFRILPFQTNDVFESIKDVARIHTPEPHGESNVERVSETSQDVALLNSEQTLVSTKEKSTKDKVSEMHGFVVPEWKN